MNKPVVVFGVSILTEMIVQDAKTNENFEIAALTVDSAYLDDPTVYGLPVVPFESIESSYPPDSFDMLLAFSGQFNMRMRETLFQRVKAKGYHLRNYISPKADVSDDVTMGENNIIMALAHVGLRGTMGNNNLVRHHVYLGHDFTLGNHIFIAPGCRIGGGCTIEDMCYVGLGSVINSATRLARESLVGSGAVVIRDTEPFTSNVGNPSRVIRRHKDQGIEVG